MPFPKIVRYRGKSYRLVEAVMPAKAAEVKMKSLSSAVARENPTARIVNADDWEMGEGGILDITSKKDGGGPMLVMWNPVTSEMAISSDRDTGIVNHYELFKRYRSKFRDYPLPHFRDWARGSIDTTANEAVLWKWDPLLEHVVYLNTPREYTEMERIHKQGLAAFKNVLSGLGAGNFRVINT